MSVYSNDEHIRLTEAIALSLQDYWNSIRLYLPHCRAEGIARAALLRLQPRRLALCDLRNLDDEGLAEEARVRELAFQDALAELARRAASGGDQDWDERSVAAMLAEKRNDIHHVDNGRTGTLPPPLFRMGYEWAALSIIRILEGVLAKPSEDICTTTEIQHVGKGLYKQVGEPCPSDPRRRAALDLIKEIEYFGQNILRGMFFRWQSKNSYAPADDAELAELLKEKREALSGGLFQCARGGGA